MGNLRGKTQRDTWFLSPWPYSNVFYKTWECSTDLFHCISCSTCVAYSRWYYVKKFTNLPVYSGLTNPYQISLKTKYFVFMSFFSLFLPKLLEPTWTSECLTVRRYKKTFVSENFGKFQGHDFGTWLNELLPVTFLPKIHPGNAYVDR